VFAWRLLSFTDPTLINGGLWFFTNLTDLDPYWRFPWLASVINFYLSRSSWLQLRTSLTPAPQTPESQALKMNTLRKIMFFILHGTQFWTLCLIPIMAKFPMISGYYLAASAITGIVVTSHSRRAQRRLAAARQLAILKHTNFQSLSKTETKDFVKHKLLPVKPKIKNRFGNVQKP